jgi:hypothetical protein
MMLVEAQDVLIELPGAKTELLQFADDTIIFTSVHPDNLHLIMIILRRFASISGLHINLQKSGFVPISLPSHNVQTVGHILGCQSLTLPLTYLGLLLTYKRPSNEIFQPLVQVVESRLQSWKGKPLSMVGREVLLNAVLNAQPIYYMQVFLLPQGIIDRLTQIT